MPKNHLKIRRKKIVLDKKKLELPKGIKITHPLEVTVSLEKSQMGSLYYVFIEGDLIPRRRLSGGGDYEHAPEIYRNVLRRLRHGDYDLHPSLEVNLSIEY